MVIRRPSLPLALSGPSVPTHGEVVYHIRLRRLRFVWHRILRCAYTWNVSTRSNRGSLSGFLSAHARKSIWHRTEYQPVSLVSSLYCLSRLLLPKTIQYLLVILRIHPKFDHHRRCDILTSEPFSQKREGFLLTRLRTLLIQGLRRGCRGLTLELPNMFKRRKALHRRLSQFLVFGEQENRVYNRFRSEKCDQSREVNGQRARIVDEGADHSEA